MDFIVKKLLNRKNMLFTIVLFSITFIILAAMVYTSYINDKNAIINQQEEQLLTIAKSTSKSLEVFLDEKADSLKIVAGNQNVALGMEKMDPLPIQQALLAYYHAQKGGVQRVFEINRKGEVVSQYPKLNGKEAENAYSMIKEDIQIVLEKKVSLIGEAKLEEPGQFIVNVFEPVFLNGEFVGILISSVDVNIMFEYLVKPVKVGQKGYVMVKDKEGIILMHPAKAQVGMDVIDTRKLIFPDFDFKDLENLIDLQMSQEEGTMVYYSYWWTDKVPERTKKLNAFARAHISDFFWIVAVTMDYDEVEGPIAQNRIKTIEIFIMILVTLSAVIFGILKIQRNREALEVETKYLRELNAAMGELRNKDLQLQHSQKLQVIGTLTGGIAHEFNNLLTPIRGYTEILKNRTDFKEDVSDYINEIHEASGKAKDIIEQILVFSRSDSGKSKFVPVEIVPLMEETLNLVKSTFTPNVVVVFEKKDDSRVILANKIQIHQVIFNLCNNAYHAMKYTGGVLKVTLDTVPSEEVKKHRDSLQHAGHYVRILVSDTGYGMSKETLSRIFDPFFTTKPVNEGTGLGLFIVHGIVENHKGIITVDSEIGKGSTFTIYFPEAGTVRQMETEQTIQDFPMDLKTVLMVDDKPKVLKVMKKGLEQFGFKVFAESNSVEALKIFEQNPSRFDAVVTDQAMPYIKGLELAERMKSLDPQIKIIIVTGFAEEKLLEYKERMIIDDYVVKPVTGRDLAMIIRKVL